MAPVSGTPRELLWYHQIRRENRHLLEQINQQQAEIDKIKSQSFADQEHREKVQQLLSELESKQATAAERRRDDFEREKEILKRVGELEESVGMLRRTAGSQPMVTGAVSQWHTLEQRLVMVEHRQNKVSDQDMQQLNMRIDALAKAMDNSIRTPINHENDSGQATEAEADLKVTEVTAGEQLRGRKGKEKEICTDETATERQPSSERPPKLVQKKRRPGSWKRIPFRPTPVDLGW